MEIGSFLEWTASADYYSAPLDVPIILPFMRGREFETSYFQNGRNAIEFLIRHLLETKSIDKVLLPDYICDSVTDAVRRASAPIKFYHINDDFSIDLDSIDDDSRAALYVAHFFGHEPDASTMSFIGNWQARGRIVIEDVTMALLSSAPYSIGFGDHVLGSLRKWFPIPDGGFVTTVGGSKNPQTLRSDISQYTYFFSLAQILKREYLDNARRGIVDGELKEFYLELYRKSTDAAFSDFTIRPMCEPAFNYLRRCEFDPIVRVRLENYNFLAKGLAAIDKVRVKLEKLPRGAVPFGLIIECERRDELQKFLIDREIYCAIHWRTTKLGRNLLTIPCDQRYGVGDMQRIVDAIAGW